MDIFPDKEVAISGVGSYSPGPAISNDELEGILKVPVKTVMSYFGVETRHYVVDPKTGKRIEPELGVTEMAARAAKKAMDNSNITTSDIDFLITSSSSIETMLPPFTHQVQSRLGLSSIQMLDIRGGCAASMQGLMIAQSLLRTGQARRVLIVGSECISPYYYVNLLNNTDPRTEDIMNGLVFADGAGAVIVELREEAEARGVANQVLKFIKSPSNFHDRPPGFGLDAKGRPRHNHKAIREVLPEVVKEAGELLARGVSQVQGGVDLLISPQANPSMIGLGDPYEFARERFYIGSETGNAPAAAIFRAMDKAIERGKLMPGKTRVGILGLETSSWGYSVAYLH
jgi:3-oxoacyl-[acyl-carrier-protein] synthase-3